MRAEPALRADINSMLPPCESGSRGEVRRSSGSRTSQKKRLRSPESGRSPEAESAKPVEVREAPCGREVRSTEALKIERCRVSPKAGI